MGFLTLLWFAPIARWLFQRGAQHAGRRVSGSVPVARFVLRRRARSRRTLACALRVQQLGLRRDPEIKERRIIES